MPRLFYPQGKSPRYPLDRGLDGPQNMSGRGEEVKILASIGTRTPTPRFPSPQPVAISTALYMKRTKIQPAMEAKKN
jgi:hypothetical protein